jgi:hypothetical protein
MDACPAVPRLSASLSLRWVGLWCACVCRLMAQGEQPQFFRVMAELGLSPNAWEGRRFTGTVRAPLTCPSSLAALYHLSLSPPLLPSSTPPPSFLQADPLLMMSYAGSAPRVRGWR